MDTRLCYNGTDRMYEVRLGLRVPSSAPHQGAGRVGAAQRRSAQIEDGAVPTFGSVSSPAGEDDPGESDGAGRPVCREGQRSVG